jgi:adenylate cyclase class IV
MKKEKEIKIELTPEEFSRFTESFSDFDLERTFGYFKEDFSNIKEGIFPRIKYVEEEERKKIIFTVKRKTKENSEFFEREEREVKIEEGEDIEDMRGILKSLGFGKEIIFEKKRYCHLF